MPIEPAELDQSIILRGRNGGYSIYRDGRNGKIPSLIGCFTTAADMIDWMRETLGVPNDQGPQGPMVFIQPSGLIKHAAMQGKLDAICHRYIEKRQLDVLLKELKSETLISTGDGGRFTAREIWMAIPDFVKRQREIERSVAQKRDASDE